MPVRSVVKQKRSFTLSPAAVKYLNRLRRERKVKSASRVLDELILDAEAARRRAEIDRQFVAYYDTMSGEEVREKTGWGELGARALATLDD